MQVFICTECKAPIFRLDERFQENPFCPIKLQIEAAFKQHQRETYQANPHSDCAKNYYMNNWNSLIPEL